ncbi:MAG TPA: aspartate/glutamate racemase family protein [Streptosporangiaceae bacterium]
MSFRLAVINPNSDQAVTDYLRAAAVTALPPDAVVQAAGCAGGPPVLETDLDSVLAAPAIVTAALGAGEPDAFVIGCFGNPAVAAVREVTAAPVVGIGEAALFQASLVAGRFGVITTLERGIAGIWSQLSAAGRAGACTGVLSVESADAAGGVLLTRLSQQGSRLLAAGADGLVLACAGFGSCTSALSAELGVPVCDGIGAAASLAYGLAASGVQTSKRGRYGWPDPAALAAAGRASGLDPLSAAEADR